MTTKRPETVRVATPADEEEIMRLMKSAFVEQPVFPLNEDKIRQQIKLCTERKGGVLGVIDGPNGIEGYIIGVLFQYWYSDAWVLEELSNFVHPDHRHPGRAKALIEFIKWFSEQLELPLIMGIMSTQRLEAKIRLYKRQVRQVGAVFAFNTGHVDGLLSEMG